MTVHWRIGNDKYNDSNSMRVGPLNGTNNGTSVQCSTNEHESPTTLLLFGKMQVQYCPCVCVYIKAVCVNCTYYQNRWTYAL